MLKNHIFITKRRPALFNFAFLYDRKPHIIQPFSLASYILTIWLSAFDSFPHARCVNMFWALIQYKDIILPV